MYIDNIYIYIYIYIYMVTKGPNMVNKWSKSGQQKSTDFFPRNDPKRFGNGSYSFWESWEPVFILKSLFFISKKTTFVPYYLLPLFPVQFLILGLLNSLSLGLRQLHVQQLIDQAPAQSAFETRRLPGFRTRSLKTSANNIAKCTKP